MEEGGDQKQCEPKATLGGIPFWLGVILMVELWDLSCVSGGALLFDLGVAEGGSGKWGCRLSWGMFFLGSVLIGKKGVAYLRRDASADEGR